MTPPDTWHPLPETVDYIARWYAWATNGAPKKARWFWHRHPKFLRQMGLCVFAPGEVREDLNLSFGGAAHPFGLSEYYYRWANHTQHLDPNRLGFCRAVLVRAGRIKENDDGMAND